MVDLESVLLSAAVSSVLSGAIALYVNKRYGPKSVQTASIRRSHSERLVKDTLTVWESRLPTYCRVGVGFRGMASGDFSPASNEGGGVIIGRDEKQALQLDLDMRVRGPIDPPIDYFAELWSHVVKGYPDVAQHWQQLKNGASVVNEKIKRFLDEVAREVSTLPPDEIPGYYHWDGSSDPPPPEFILLGDIVFLIWLWLEEGSTRKKKLQYKTLDITGPKTTHWKLGGREINPDVYELDWKNLGHPTLLRAYSKERCERVRLKIESVSTSTINIGRVSELIGEMNDFERFVSQFQKELRAIRTEVDLGRNLKGDCPVCDTLA